MLWLYKLYHHVQRISSYDDDYTWVNLWHSIFDMNRNVFYLEIHVFLGLESSLMCLEYIGHIMLIRFYRLQFLNIAGVFMRIFK